jgi:hypothetical protein
MNSGKYAFSCPVSFDPPVELGLEQLPDPVPVRSDDQGAFAGPRSTNCALVTSCCTRRGSPRSAG